MRETLAADVSREDEIDRAGREGVTAASLRERRDDLHLDWHDPLKTRCTVNVTMRFSFSGSRPLELAVPMKAASA